MTLSTDELEALKQRLDRLERGNRRLRRVGLFAGLGVGLALLMGQASHSNVPEIIESQRFVVKDTSGRSIAALGIDRDGAPSLVLTNLDGGLAATLDVTASKTPTLTLYDKLSKSRAVMTVDSDGSPAISMNDKNGAPRVGLAVATQGSGGLVLYGDRNTARASLGLGANWSPYLVLLDDSGNLRMGLGHADAFPPALTKTFRVADYSMMLLDTRGDMVWSAPQKELAPAANQSKVVTKGKSKTGTVRR